MITREKLEELIEKRVKGLLLEGIYPGSISFIMGKMLILRQVSREFGVNFKYKVESNKVWIIDKLIRTGILRHLWFVRMIGKIIKMPRLIFPIWHYEMDGHTILMNEGDVMMRAILKDYTLKEIWEPQTTKIVKQNVKQGMTALDIGASIGYFTLLFCRQVGREGKVISFEPTEMNFNYLCENLRLNNYTAMPYKMAAWDKEELVRMPASSPKPVWANGVAVGEFLEKQGIDKVDFIKIDVDGPEPKVLKGLIKVFEKNPQLKMVIEYYPKYIKSGGFSPEEFMRILKKYFTYKVIPDDYSKGCWNLFCERK